jgi:hypothetical protein
MITSVRFEIALSTPYMPAQGKVGLMDALYVVGGMFAAMLVLMGLLYVFLDAACLDSRGTCRTAGYDYGFAPFSTGVTGGDNPRRVNKYTGKVESVCAAGYYTRD